jgi:hypothetical protein
MQTKRADRKANPTTQEKPRNEAIQNYTDKRLKQCDENFTRQK